MRLASPLLVTAALLALAACDDEQKPAPGGSPSGTAAAPSSVVSAAPAKSAAAPGASASADAGPPMPPRPFPIGSSGPVQPSDPPEQQMMAINYTLAMVTPRGMDPLVVDRTYLDDIVKKLEGAVRGADKGKTPPNPVKTAKGDRKIEVLMGKGCTDRVPNLLMQRANSSLKAAYEAGVLAISCHDDKWECHQSTRDPKDVLCHAAPRH